MQSIADAVGGIRRHASVLPNLTALTPLSPKNRHSKSPGSLREPGRPTAAYMVMLDEGRRYIRGAFIALDKKMRECIFARVHKTRGKAVKGVCARVRIARDALRGQQPPLPENGTVIARAGQLCATPEPEPG